jgi:hypothetical protein
MGKHIQNFSKFNESLKTKLSFLEGKPISLIRTSRKLEWDSKANKMEEITKEDEINGFIGEIGPLETMSWEVPGFWVVDENGKKKALVMYGKTLGIEGFIDGDSSSYSYKGKTDKDERILKLVLDNLS